MTLREKSRTTMFHEFSQLLGEEVAEDMLSQFPAHEGDELVTKTFLRAEVAGLETKIAELRTDVQTTIQGQTKWLAGVVITALFGGLAASAAIAQSFG